MELYHGSSVIVRKPEIRISNRYLDFGYGFYTTTNMNQAIGFAEKVAKRSPSRNKVVSVYDFDKDTAFSQFNALVFDKPDEAWLDFVATNRNGVYAGENFDIVFGPVANDDVYETLTLYFAGAYTKEYALGALKIKRLYNQMVFLSEASLSHLRFSGTLGR
jgi:hypothetical protein